MYQKLMIFSLVILGLASCSAPKKATYVEPVISAKPIEKATEGEVVEHSIPTNRLTAQRADSFVVSQ